MLRENVFPGKRGCVWDDDSDGGCTMPESAGSVCHFESSLHGSRHGGYINVLLRCSSDNIGSGRNL